MKSHFKLSHIQSEKAFWKLHASLIREGKLIMGSIKDVEFIRAGLLHAKERERQKRIAVAHKDPVFGIPVFLRTPQQKKKIMRLLAHAKMTKEERQEYREKLRSERSYYRQKERSRLAATLHTFIQTLESMRESIRFKGIAWFRAVRKVSDPYLLYQLKPPANFNPQELTKEIPITWKLHATDYNKCRF